MVGLRQDRATRPGERKSRQAYEVFRRQKTRHLVIGCYGEADLWLVVPTREYRRRSQFRGEKGRSSFRSVKGWRKMRYTGKSLEKDPRGRKLGRAAQGGGWKKESTGKCIKGCPLLGGPQGCLFLCSGGDSPRPSLGPLPPHPGPLCVLW